MSRGALALVALVGVALLPAPGRAHTRLVAASPAEGDTLAAAPTLLRLEFSDPVDPESARLAITRPDGTVFRLVAERDSDDSTILTSALAGLGSGPHRVTWRVVSPDGHPVTGSYVFVVEPPGAPPTDAHPRVPPPASFAREAGPGAVGVAAVLRGVSIAALLALAGLLAFRTAEPVDDRERRATLALAVAAPLLLAGHVAAWTLYVAPERTVEEALAVLGTTAGRLEVLRLGLASLALWALALARRPRLALGFAALGVLAGSGLGHSGAIVPAASIPARAVHLAAAAAWTGGLVSLLVGDPSGDPLAYRARARRVSKVALASVSLLALSGGSLAFLFMGEWGDLVSTRYGALVLAKAGGLAILVGIGARNRTRHLPRLLEEGSPAPLRRAVRREVGVLAAVLLVAAVLAYTPPRPEAHAGPRSETVHPGGGE